MTNKRISIQRIVFLSVLAAVFVVAYVADWSIFAAIIEIISFASPYLEHFIMLFLILSFTCLCVYYYFVKYSNQVVSERLLEWLKILSWAFFTAFAISAVFIYLNIYFDARFDT